MAEAFLGLELSETSVPPYLDLRGLHLQSELRRIELRVNKIKSSWKTTGCSVLVDGWTDEKGRDLINVLVDCLEGPIYLKSSDISAAMEDYDALLLVFDEIIKEVGADNLVQIISNYKSSGMDVVGKLFMAKYPTIMWTVSSTHCFELILEKIGTMDFIKPTFNSARALTKFIYSHKTVLTLMRSYTNSSELVKSTKIKSTMPFLTLENIVAEKKNLKKMFSSFEWRSSVWASSKGGRRIADLVRDASFWSGADVVVKATLPVVRALHLIHESVAPQLGFIYETMDQVKETIRNGLGEEAQYMPYWKAIDDLWNKCLHSPLHSAAHCLNPLLRYSKDFYPDTEVTAGVYSCIAHMVEDKKLQLLTMEQAGLYTDGKGCFSDEEAIQQSSSLSYVDWWSSYSKECPELKSLAIRILNQTCDGASKYHLDKSLAEKLFAEGRLQTNQQLLKDQIFCHYNNQLEKFVPGPSNYYCEIDPMNDWIVDETLDKALLKSEPIRMELACSHGATTTTGSLPARRK